MLKVLFLKNGGGVGEGKARQIRKDKIYLINGLPSGASKIKNVSGIIKQLFFGIFKKLHLKSNFKELKSIEKALK